MKRPLAVFGFSYLFAMFMAAQLPEAFLLPLAAVLVLGFAAGVVGLWRRKAAKATTAGSRSPFALGHKALALLLVTGASLAAFAVNMGYQAWVVNPVAALDGQTSRVLARVTEISPGNSSDTEHAAIQILELDGEPVATPIKTELRNISSVQVDDLLEAELRFYRDSSRRYASYHAARGRYISVSPTSGIQVVGHSPSVMGRIRLFQYTVSSHIQQRLPLRLSSVATAMTVGDRRFISQQTTEAFRMAGLSHMLVVSGLHLSVLSNALYACFTVLLRKHKKVVSFLCMAFILFFMAFTGFTPSIIRSGIAHLLFFMGPLFSRKADVYTSLGFAALLLCTLNPYAAVDAGLLLSFTATLGAVQGGQIATSLRRRWQEKPAAPPVQGFRWLCRTAMVPVCVTVATLPVLAWMGGGLSLLSIPLNLLAVPLLIPIVLSGFAMALPTGFFLFNIIGQAGALVGGALLALLEWLTNLCTHLPFAYLPVGGLFGLTALLVVYGLAFLAQHTRKYKGYAIAAVLVLCTAVCMQMFLAAGTVTVTVAGSGANPSLLVIYNGQAAVLYRSHTSLSAIERIMWEQGVREVTLLVDLRQNTQRTEYVNTLRPQQVVIAQQDFRHSAVFTPFEKVDIYLLNQNKGTFACVDVGGYKTGLASGSVQLGRDMAVDTLLAGSGTVNARYQTLLTSGGVPEWANPQENILQGDTAQLVIRPGKSIRWREAYHGDDAG